MSYVIFRYQNSDLTIPCEETDLLSIIIQKFCAKTQLDKNKLTFFCNGRQANEELPLSQFPLNEYEPSRIILALDYEEENNEKHMKKSDNIICPQCKESIIISIKDYKVSLFQCKNGHKIENLSLTKYNETQNINISEIHCGVCGKNKAEIEQNQMFICIFCKLNLCPICKNNHDKTHNIINYEKKNYICPKDGEYFNLYCNDCKKNICSSCEYGHIEHKTITFGMLMKNRNEFAFRYYKLEDDIFKFKNVINEVISKLNKLVEGINIYYEINTKIFKAVTRKYRNSEELFSINQIDNNRMSKDLRNIINEKNINNKIISIMKLYDAMEIEKKEDDKTDIQPINNNINIIKTEKKDDGSKNNNLIINKNDNKGKVDNINNNENNEFFLINTDSNNIINNDINNNSNKNTINDSKEVKKINKDININHNIQNFNINNINNNAQNNNNINNEMNINNNIRIENNRNNNSNELGFLQEFLNIQNENQIKEVYDSLIPLISEPLNIQTLINDYEGNSIYFDSVMKIAIKYKLIRKISNDGNCFYRGFIYRLFEYIGLNQNNYLFDKILKKIDEIKELVKKNHEITVLFDNFFSDFLNEFYNCCGSLSNNRNLEALFNNANKEKCNYLVLFIRYGIGEYLRQNKSIYESCVEGDFNNWINKDVMTMDKDAELLQIIACAKLFDVGIKIEKLNKDKNEVIKYPENIRESEIFIKFLLASEHYDLLYD